MKIIAAVIAWAALAAGGGVPAATAAATTPDPAVIDADNVFGLKLLQELRTDGADNVAISPTSVAMALQMVLNGAEGPTRQAMTSALQLNALSVNGLNTANQALQASLAGAGSKIQLTIANSLWVRQGRPAVKPAFTQINRDYYAAEIGDLAGAPDNVNAWISQRTNGLITQLLPAKNYQDAVAVVVNAVYFRGTWSVPFQPELTALGLFTTASGSRASCLMMKQSRHIPYFEATDFRAIRLAYGEGRMSMVILLPNGDRSLAAVTAQATASNLKRWLTQFRPQEIKLSLPRFTVSYKKSLPAALRALGMGIAFDPQRADFTGIAPQLYLSDIEHAARVQVDETGTTAAAASSGMASLAGLASLPVIFNVDHPFFFAIVDDATGALLFVGTVGNPG